MQRILLVDDDIELVEMIREYLEPEGFAVDVAYDSETCLANDPERMDLIVLDVMLPGLSGFEVLKRLRQRSSVPVILLTARDSDTDRVVGLEIGADDYVPKPFNPRELVARIRAILRRTSSNAARNGGDLTVGDVQLNVAARTARCKGHLLDLTTAEFNLLAHLLSKGGQIVTRDELSAAAFGRQRTPKIDRNVDTLVSKVRRKLDPEGDIEWRIKTVRNVGYLYAIPADATEEGKADATDALR
ncbi:MAG: response regulator transcription factor [Alphaproteobacteria bacterium]